MPEFDGPFLGYSELPNNRFWVVVSPDIGLLGAERAGRNSPAEIRNGPSREVGQNLIKSGQGSIWLKVMARSFYPRFGTTGKNFYLQTSTKSKNKIINNNEICQSLEPDPAGKKWPI